MSQIKVGEFAFHKGKPVGVRAFFAGIGECEMAKVAYIHNNQEVSVPLLELLPFTRKTANAAISEYNVRIHSIRDCLLYCE